MGGIGKLWLVIVLAAVVCVGAILYAGATASPPQSPVEQTLDRKQFGF